MKTTLPGRYRAFTIILLSVVIHCTSCKVRMLSEYDAALTQQINATAKTIDDFYINMASQSAPFAQFEHEYTALELQIDSLVEKNRVKALNQHSLRISEIALQSWRKYRDEHQRDGTLTSGIIALNRKYMADLFYAMKVASEAAKITN